MSHEFAYGLETIRYQVQWMATRRTLGIEVHPDQRVVVRAPVGCAEDVIAARVKHRAAWISRQIAEFKRYNPRTPPRQFVSGETHLYLGRQYRLKVKVGETPSVRMVRGQLIVTLLEGGSPDRIKTMLHRWYLDNARLVFAEMLEQCLLRFNSHERPRLIVRTMQSRWGSLSRAGSMTLNVNLVRGSRACIEYVITHELCHLVHRDHDASFYRLLGRVMPDWEQRKQLLEGALL